MAKEVIWSPEAREVFENVVAYLQSNWTDKEVEHFIKATEKVVELISNQPKLYRSSKTKKNIHEHLLQNII